MTDTHKALFSDLEARMRYQADEGENFVMTPDEARAMIDLFVGLRALLREADLSHADYVFVPDIDRLLGTNYGRLCRPPP